MSRYINNYTDEVYVDEDTAREAMMDEYDWDDIAPYFFNTMTKGEFLRRCYSKCPNFFEEFEMEFCEAENAYFNDNYSEIDEEDDDDDETEYVIVPIDEP